MNFSKAQNPTKYQLKILFLLQENTPHLRYKVQSVVFRETVYFTDNQTK